MAAILIIEDEHALGSALSMAIHRLGHTAVLAASGAAALEKIKAQKFEAIVLDIGLPDVSGMDILAKIRKAGSKIPILIITAHATLDHTITSQKLGVADYLIKPLDLQRFEEVVSSMVTKSIPIAEPNEPTTISLIGAATSMHRVFLGIARACSSDMPVMLHGPCGTGKTLAARVIHTNSHRSADALRVVECSGISNNEALQTYLADPKGTLVLEGLEALNPIFQASLAEMIGQSQIQLPRLIATLQIDPREAEANHVLRSDLFYAFSALSIEMPALKERTGDISALCRFFHGLGNAASSRFEMSSATLCTLQAYDWPGNVRELRHVIEHALALSHGGPILPSHLPPHVAQAFQASGGKLVSGELDHALARWLDSQLDLTDESEWQYDTLLDQIEVSMLRHLLDRFDQRPTRLAAALQMNRATLRQKLRRGGLASES